MKSSVKKIIIAIICVAFCSCSKNEKAGFINLQDVFSEFEFKKELQKQLEDVQTKRKNILDSLEFDLKVHLKKVNNDRRSNEDIAVFETRREEFYRKRQLFEEQNAETIKQMDAQIIRQLNQYVRDFGLKNNYKIIYGTDGTGSIMYADSSMNITRDVIAFVNNSYKGKNK